MSSLVNTPPVAVIEQAYNKRALSGLDSTLSSQMAQSVGYTEADLERIPTAARLGAGCGNPVAAAHLLEGETVVDLGSGGGIDILLASSQVGPHGQAVGIDISPAMISLARKNAAEKGLRPPDVAFVESSLAEPLPLVSESVDCVLSNCVINLLTPQGKRSIYNEVYRILKPGGRLVVDDIIAKKLLNAEILNNVPAYVNCISGAVQKEEHETYLQDAGFSDCSLKATDRDLTKLCSSVDSCMPTTKKELGDFDVNEYVASFEIRATKPHSDKRGQAENSRAQTASALSRWWDAYPKAKSTPSLIQPHQLVDLIRVSSDRHSLSVIDVRRDDHSGGHVRGSNNWPAQTFYDDLPTFLEKYRNTDRVVFYCQSSSGRGPRCAGWYQDLLNETDTATSRAYVLAGGIKAWLAEYGGDQSLVDRD